MSTIRNPVGPQSPRVYWRRRLVVGILFVAVVVAIILIVARCTSGSGTPTGNSSSTTPKPSNTSTNAAGDVPECDPAKVTLEAVTDAAGYDAGVIPQLSLVVKSTGTEPCTFEVGTDVQEFTVTSGDEVIWRSSDCQIDAAPRTQLLNPGVPVSSAAIPWDRTRSSTDTCDAARDQVTAGGASYHLEVSIGDLKSVTTKQFILY